MTSALKALAAQVSGKSANAETSTNDDRNKTTVRIAEIRREADEARDSLRHRLRS